jgi:hypothetical protein
MASDYSQKWKAEFALAQFIAAQQKRTLASIEAGLKRNAESPSRPASYHSPDMKETIMKVAVTAATLAALSLGLATAGIAQAGETAPSLTRAQVVQQLHEAQAQGLVQIGEHAYPVEQAAHSDATRAEVVADLRQAQARGLVSFGEQADYPAASADAQPLSRAQVLNELREARSAGLLTEGEDPSYPIL